MRSAHRNALAKAEVRAHPAIQDREPMLLLAYTDAVEGFNGYLAIDSMTYPLVVGGFRVQSGLTAERIARLAQTMTLKQRIAGLNVGGAKSGIDYDPTAPGKAAAITRFMRAIRPYLMTIYSMGPDLNTRFSELEDIAHTLRLSSIKGAIAPAQRLHVDEFQQRLAVLDQVVDGLALGRQRAGYGVAAAASATLEALDLPMAGARVLVHGLGALGGAAACRLALRGVRVSGVADASGAAFQCAGFSAESLVAGMDRQRLPGEATARSARPETLFEQPADVLILAAKEDSMDASQAARLRCRIVVAGANLALSAQAEAVLHRRGIPVVPDFVAGCGGSLAVDGLFGSPDIPTAREVLTHIEHRMRTIVVEMLGSVHRQHQTPREAALQQCAAFKSNPLDTPYGHCHSSRKAKHA